MYKYVVDIIQIVKLVVYIVNIIQDFMKYAKELTNRPLQKHRDHIFFLKCLHPVAPIFLFSN